MSGTPFEADWSAERAFGFGAPGHEGACIFIEILKYWDAGIFCLTVR
jgi:hypothetical protein